MDVDAVEKTDAEITILVCGSSSYYSAVAVSETDTTTDADVVTAVSGSSYYFSAAADLVMDADVAIEILFLLISSARRGNMPRLSFGKNSTALLHSFSQNHFSKHA